MQVDISQLIIALLGGSGLTGLGVKLWQVIREHRQGSLQKDTTAVSQWQEIAERDREHYQMIAAEALAENKELEAANAALRTAYAALWREYTVGPPPGSKKFPFDPLGRD